MRVRGWNRYRDTRERSYSFWKQLKGEKRTIGVKERARFFKRVSSIRPNFFFTRKLFKFDREEHFVSPRKV